MDSRSPDELLELIRWLPDGSAFRASQAADAARCEASGEEVEQPKPDRFSPMHWFGWDTAQYTRVALVNEQRLGNYYTLMANRGKGSAPQKPVPFPLPGDKSRSDEAWGQMLAAREAGLKAQKKSTT